MTIDFSDLKVRTNGLLDPGVYRAIHEAAARARGDILEIGTAHGAATIAAALGAPPSVRVTTVDRLHGGTRDSYGGVDDNLRIVRRNFESFGVADRIEMLVGDIEEVAPRIDLERGLGMLVLDADGAVDRDLGFFYDSLIDDAPIVIDDYKPNFVLMTPKNSVVEIDQKHRLTAMLVSYFEEVGMLRRDRIVGNTYFGRKGDPRARPEAAAVLAIYRRLTFAEGRVRWGLAARISWRLAAKAPGLHLRLKRMAGRVVE